MLLVIKPLFYKLHVCTLLFSKNVLNIVFQLICHGLVVNLLAYKIIFHVVIKKMDGDLLIYIQDYVAN